MQPVFVGYVASSIHDGFQGGQGNGDRNVNPGEEIALPTQVKNFGTNAAAAVVATLTSADPYVTMVYDTATIGDLPAGSSAWAQGLAFQVSSDCPDGRVLRFGLDCRSDLQQWHSMFELRVRSSDLAAVGKTLYNAGPNGLFDPAETIEMSVQLRNAGFQSATGVTAQIYSHSPWIQIVDGNAVFGDIPAGGTAENTSDRFTVSASAQTYQGYNAEFTLITSADGDHPDTTKITVPVGTCSSDDPVGPDGYGYYAFDDTDVSYSEAPVYNWIEIDPAYGGNGTEIPLGDYTDYQDKSRTVDMPFTFRYYGRTFQQATVCSNGWLSMGHTYLTDYRNWSIPGAGAPEDMIAPYWDDLYQSGNAKAYQKYDAAGHRWIVEWSRFRNAADGSVQTFEVILYDPAFYPTPTGDGPIVFQYNAVTNPDNVDERATVGIENLDHTEGLEYTYFALYPAGAAQLAPGRAIRFVTVAPDPTAAPEPIAAPGFRIAGGNPNPFTSGTSIAFSIARSGPVRLAIYDAAGRRIRTLIDEVRPAGPHTALWDGRQDSGSPAPAGVYFYRLEAEGRSAVHTIVRVR